MQGNRNFLLLLGAVLTKAIRDSFGRVLLMGAAKGWGIIHEEISSGVWIIVTSGILYFFFDIAYEVIIRVHEGIPLWMLLLVSLPLIVLNTLVFYFVFAWFSQVFYTLNLLKQLYKLRLLKQFAFVLGIAGTISIIWTIVDTLARVFLNKENTWQWMWLYIGIWDIIFLLLVISLMIIWRINKNSKLLATSQEIRSDDNELSYEEEEKYGVELAKVK
jgi:Lung seven transmembrane receptor